MRWVTSKRHMTAEASSRLNRRPCRFKWTRPFRRKMKFGLCACVITFQTHFTPVEVAKHMAHYNRRISAGRRSSTHAAQILTAVLFAGKTREPALQAHGDEVMP
jgi:hypothetical protein